jgi:peptidoglycan/LPS O-acetylase OafA/YrhL
MCYTIYLYHLTIISLVTRPLFKLFKPGLPLESELWITLAVCIPVVLVLSAVLFALVEKPFMNFGVVKRPASRSALISDPASAAEQEPVIFPQPSAG